MSAKEIGKTLKELRLKANLSQKKAYEHVGVAQSTFSSWETGKAEPPTDILLKLCQLYKVDNILTAFGYDGYNEDGSLLLNLKEIELIEKYRDLDPHGKDMVDTVLDKEHTRCQSEKIVTIDTEELKQKEQERLKEYSKLLGAASQRKDIEIPEGIDTSDDDMMDENKF